MLFADLLSLHLATFLMFFYSCFVMNVLEHFGKVPKNSDCTIVPLSTVSFVQELTLVGL